MSIRNDIIAEMTHDELNDKLSEESSLYRTMKMNHAISPLENPMELRAKRRLIARLKTELRSRDKKN